MASQKAGHILATEQQQHMFDYRESQITQLHFSFLSLGFQYNFNGAVFPQQGKNNFEESH